MYLKLSNISDALNLVLYTAVGLTHINFNDCIKYTLIVQSPVFVTALLECI